MRRKTLLSWVSRIVYSNRSTRFKKSQWRLKLPFPFGSFHSNSETSMCIFKSYQSFINLNFWIWKGLCTLAASRHTSSTVLIRALVPTLPELPSCHSLQGSVPLDPQHSYVRQFWFLHTGHAEYKVCDSKHTKFSHILVISKCILLSTWKRGRGGKGSPGLDSLQDALPTLAAFRK